ncbi:MAG: tRNA (guanosine(46)-N7)-methyltransferase TrmB [Clostridia bacterium]|nr:tRNA (guanosine(46)-N7)-methyltransferase TrmB [Clostridia bacterium]
MRMRRKKHLDERLSDCAGRYINLRAEAVRFDAEEQPKYLCFRDLFGNDNPVELEIGCGKGGFICELAARNPDVNFLAVEKYANVLVTACEAAQEQGLDNILFLWCDAEYLPRFIPPHSVRRLYLNFSTPFPKKRQATHRLTHPHFLQMYKGLLTPDASLIQKTDGRVFFQYSLEQLSRTGYTLQSVSLDLHADGIEDNIVTEYERRFMEQGLPIYRVEATIHNEKE